MGARITMKRIVIFSSTLALFVWAFRRLNRLVAGVQSQKIQLDELQVQIAELRALLEAQRAVMDAMLARWESTETAIAEGLSERRELWRERLSDLDSLN